VPLALTSQAIRDLEALLAFASGRTPADLCLAAGWELYRDTEGAMPTGDVSHRPSEGIAA
jgi:hypothetical protein